MRTWKWLACRVLLECVERCPSLHADAIITLHIEISGWAIRLHERGYVDLIPTERNADRVAADAGPAIQGLDYPLSDGTFFTFSFRQKAIDPDRIDPV